MRGTASLAPRSPRRQAPWSLAVVVLLLWSSLCLQHANAGAAANDLRQLQATRPDNTTDSTTTGDGSLQLPASSRVVNVTLGMGCPEFLSAFYQANVSSAVPYRSFSITKGAGYGYVALHFAQLWLPVGASIVLRGVENVDVPDRLLNLTSAAFPSGVMHENVYAPPMLAKELLIELYRDVGPAATATATVSATSGTVHGNGNGNSNGNADGMGPGAGSSNGNANGTSSADAIVNDRHCYGLVVDAYNYVLVDVARNITPSNEAQCANDNSREAVCYFDDAATRPAYLASRAVARLLIQKEDGKSSACTGWLLGAKGHLVTNYHCVSSPAQAAATTVEFMADSPSCAQSCLEWGACAGTVEAISATLVRANAELDYALLQLQTNVNLVGKYGFLRLKATQASVNQEVYIPQHPLFYGKRIAMLNDFGTKTTILSTEAAGCNATGYSYNGDTQAGSSGSPVLDAGDHGVVALHHCGQFCANTGIPSTRLIADMQAAGVLPPAAVDTGDKKNAGNFPSWQPPEAVAPRTLLPVLAFNGAIRRDAVARTVSVDQFDFELTKDAEVEFDVLSAEVSDDGAFQDVNGDCAATYLDAIVFLFRAGDSTAVLTKDDDKPGKGRGDGSISARDPYARTFLKAGKYTLAVAAMPANATSAFSGVVPLRRDDPEIYDCVAHAQAGAYRVTFQSSEAMTFSRVPQAVAVPAACAVPASAICSF